MAPDTAAPEQTCWWCGGTVPDDGASLTVTGRETKEVRVHVGRQTRRPDDTPVCIKPGNEEEW